MAYVAIDDDGTELIFDSQPERYAICWHRYEDSKEVELPKGSIRRLIGHELTFKDDPVELKEVQATGDGDPD